MGKAGGGDVICVKELKEKTKEEGHRW